MSRPDRTTTERRRALDVIRAGGSVRDAMRETGVPDGTIRRWVRYAGLPMPRVITSTAPPSETLAEAVRRVASGARVSPTARALGLSAETTRRACHAAGIAMPPPGRPYSAAATAAVHLVETTGATYAVAARLTGASTETVRDRIARPHRHRKSQPTAGVAR